LIQSVEPYRLLGRESYFDAVLKVGRSIE
jgi:hypothetical protein